ncbi:MAG: hypothetical protein A2231_04050 [Candidatus Firestonebacteria bacterium RIFOXYA2_FULL_40_8]|nr:MAG: hypothetical protein A2231_04050 [Candidatus Firestonebacteria bacterium RIFOXYA2_FULL_40_8]
MHYYFDDKQNKGNKTKKMKNNFKNIILFANADVFVPILGWVFSICLYNTFWNHSPLKLQLNTIPEYIMLVNGAIVLYVLLLFICRTITSSLLAINMFNRVQLFIAILIYDSVLFYILYYRVNSTRTIVILWLYIITVSTFAYTQQYFMKKSASFIGKNKKIFISFVHAALYEKCDKTLNYIIKKTSLLYILNYMFMLVICTFLLILKKEWLAEPIAFLAYFFLSFGIVTEVYYIIKRV